MNKFYWIGLWIAATLVASGFVLIQWQKMAQRTPFSNGFLTTCGDVFLDGLENAAVPTYRGISREGVAQIKVTKFDDALFCNLFETYTNDVSDIAPAKRQQFQPKWLKDPLQVAEQFDSWIDAHSNEYDLTSIDGCRSGPKSNVATVYTKVITLADTGRVLSVELSQANDADTGQVTATTLNAWTSNAAADCARQG